MVMISLSATRDQCHPLKAYKGLYEPPSTIVNPNYLTCILDIASIPSRIQTSLSTVMNSMMTKSLKKVCLLLHFPLAV
jgi:hypothetical protein